MKIHYADEYLFNMQDWNPEVARQGFQTLQELHLKPMARYCDGKHSKVTSTEPTFIIEEVSCKHCLKKLKKETK